MSFQMVKLNQFFFRHKFNGIFLPSYEEHHSKLFLPFGEKIRSQALLHQYIYVILVASLQFLIFQIAKKLFWPRLTTLDYFIDI